MEDRMKRSIWCEVKSAQIKLRKEWKGRKRKWNESDRNQLRGGGRWWEERGEQRQASKDLITSVARIKFGTASKSSSNEATRLRNTHTRERQSEYRTFCTQTLSFLSWSPSTLTASLSALPVSDAWMRAGKFSCCKIKHMPCDCPLGWRSGDVICTCVCRLCCRFRKYIPQICLCF